MDVISLYSLDWNIDENIIISKKPSYREAPAEQKKIDIIKKSFFRKFVRSNFKSLYLPIW